MASTALTADCARLSWRLVPLRLRAPSMQAVRLPRGGQGPLCSPRGFRSSSRPDGFESHVGRIPLCTPDHIDSTGRRIWVAEGVRTAAIMRAA